MAEFISEKEAHAQLDMLGLYPTGKSMREVGQRAAASLIKFVRMIHPDMTIGEATAWVSAHAVRPTMHEDYTIKDLTNSDASRDVETKNGAYVGIHRGANAVMRSVEFNPDFLPFFGDARDKKSRIMAYDGMPKESVRGIAGDLAIDPDYAMKFAEDFMEKARTFILQYHIDTTPAMRSEDADALLEAAFIQPIGAADSPDDYFLSPMAIELMNFPHIAKTHNTALVTQTDYGAQGPEEAHWRAGENVDRPITQQSRLSAAPASAEERALRLVNREKTGHAR